MKSPKGKKSAHRAIDIGVAILLMRDRVWVQQRAGTGHLDGYWEFPGGKVRAGETPAEAVMREIREETGWRLESEMIQHIRTDLYEYPDRSLRLHFFLCPMLQEPTQIPSGQWIDPEEIQHFRMPPANEKAIQWLLTYAGAFHNSDV